MWVGHFCPTLLGLLLFLPLTLRQTKAKSNTKTNPTATGKSDRPTRALMHIEKAQPRNSATFQQTFVDILLLQLFDLCCRHVPAVGSQVAVGFGAHRN